MPRIKHKKTRQLKAEQPPSCDQCGFQSFNEQNCNICMHLEAVKRSRECLRCKKGFCDAFCDWCGAGYHRKCGKADGVKISASTGEFTCHSCDREDADEGTLCGLCGTGFARGDEPCTGLVQDQLVLIERKKILFMATIVSLKPTKDKVKVRFNHWHKKHDEWISVHDNALQESLACDCCSRWFHIACLPPFGKSGRKKKHSFVCGGCYEDAQPKTMTRTKSPPTLPEMTITKKRRNRLDSDETPLHPKKRALSVYEEQSNSASPERDSPDSKVELEATAITDLKAFEPNRPRYCLATLLNSSPSDDNEPVQASEKCIVAESTVKTISGSFSEDSSDTQAFDILRTVASQSIYKEHLDEESVSVKTEVQVDYADYCKSTPEVAEPEITTKMVDVEVECNFDSTFALREEMYLEFCRMEEEGIMTSEVAKTLRSFTHPTARRFQDLRFLYLVNKQLPVQSLADRLGELCADTLREA